MAPFFVFQVLCLLLWSLDDYWYYSVFTLLLLMFFEGMLCKQRQASLLMLRNMRRPSVPMWGLGRNIPPFLALNRSTVVNIFYAFDQVYRVLPQTWYHSVRFVLRGGEWEVIYSEELVPGDVVSLRALVPLKSREFDRASITSSLPACLNFFTIYCDSY